MTLIWTRGLLALLLVGSSALAQAAQAWLYLENDIVSGSDGHYTGGMELGIAGSETSCSGPLAGKGRCLLAGQLRLLAFTPRNTRVERPVNDLPYAGVALWDTILFHRPEDARHVWQGRLRLGWLGPSTHIGEAQQQIHRLLGNHIPTGWRHQLGDQPVWGAGLGVAAPLMRGRRNGWALNGHVGAEVGTLSHYVNASLLLRLGGAALCTFDQVLGGSASRALVTERGWHVDLGLQLAWMPHNLLVEAAPGLRQVDWLPRAMVNVGYDGGRWALAWRLHAARYPSLEREEIDSWGGLALSVRL
ncbi:lipid A-modifier LpxR family protein [Sulfurivirga sp.]|uniref:lipid A-modifier LpxR family protein n=1 Tax=Sulfurivirga sp. TaxID=2614236 RepID=UPI0025CF7E6A|nr:lipid A-modifier LpxR family protein [Sulfurivirga sp.]